MEVIKAENVKLTNKAIKKIYFDSFPKSERMPFWMMVAMSKLWNTEFSAYYDNDIPVGFIYFAQNAKLVFIMFFAVDESLRSHGYGSMILQKLQSRYPKKKIIVSIEPCDKVAFDYELRLRRREFYKRNGFSETGWRMKLSGVEQEILCTGGEFKKYQFISFFAHYSNATVWPKIWRNENKNDL